VYVVVVSDSTDLNSLRFVIFPCVSLLFVAVLVCIVVCICRRRAQRAASDGKSPRTASQAAAAALLHRDGNSPTAAAASTSERPVEVPMSSVHLVRDICEDHRFRGNRVYLGQLAVSPHVQHPWRPVVVRTLGVDADERSCTEFWRDVDALHALRHPHISAVVGVTGRSTVAATVSVLLECGHDLVNLHQYVVYADNDPTSLDHIARLRIAIEIAFGMDYLSSRGIVHGDLASRNVMMITTAAGIPPAVAKLCVGLSLGPALFPDDYQKVRADCPPLPVRWMAPETIATGGRCPTIPADVWSYGVTLWELYSAGCRPYEGFADDELVGLILARQLLPCPPPPAEVGVATARVFQLMTDCWAPLPGDRPSFADVLARLQQWGSTGAVAAAAGRRPDSSSRSNSTRSNSDATAAPRRLSPFVAARTCRADDNNHASAVAVSPDAFQRLRKDAPQKPSSELTTEGNSARRDVEYSAHSAHHGYPATDVTPLRTVEVL